LWNEKKYIAVLFGGRKSRDKVRIGERKGKKVNGEKNVVGEEGRSSNIKNLRSGKIDAEEVEGGDSSGYLSLNRRGGGLADGEAGKGEDLWKKTLYLEARERQR